MSYTTEIVSALSPYPFIGTHNCDNCAEKPVITYGESRVWNITHQDDGTYTFALDGQTAIPNNDNSAVVVSQNGTYSQEVIFPNNDPMTFMVRVRGANAYWTLARSVPDTQVEIKPYEQGNEGQVFASSIRTE